MKNVLIITAFKDKYTGIIYDAGKIVEMTEERIREVKEVNPGLIEVVGKAVEPVATVEPEAEVEVPEVEVPETPPKATKKNK